MGKLNLNEFLRYGLSGFVALFTLALTDPQTPVWLYSDHITSPAFFVSGFALLIGIFIYSFHRVILYPIIYRILLHIIHKFEWNVRFVFPWSFSNQELELDVKRSEKRNKKPNFYETGFNEWFSRIHFLYCSAWAIFITLVYGYLFNTCESISEKHLLFSVLGLLIFFMALVDDIHAMKLEKELLKNKQALSSLSQNLLTALWCIACTTLLFLLGFYISRFLKSDYGTFTGAAVWIIGTIVCAFLGKIFIPALRDPRETKQTWIWQSLRILIAVISLISGILISLIINIILIIFIQSLFPTLLVGWSEILITVAVLSSQIVAGIVFCVVLCQTMEKAFGIPPE